MQIEFEAIRVSDELSLNPPFVAISVWLIA
jgi:hypothetical protein